MVVRNWGVVVVGLLVGSLGLFGCNDQQLGPTPPRYDQPVAVIESSASSYATLDTALFDGSSSYDPKIEAIDSLGLSSLRPELAWLPGAPTLVRCMSPGVVMRNPSSS